MDLIRWKDEDGSARVDDYGFFERPLTRPALFSFTTRRMRVEPHGGAWSLKFALSGAETYVFGARRLALQPGEMLLVERDRSYGSEIARPTASLSLFFPDPWVLDTAAALRRSAAASLDQASATEAPPMPAVPVRLSSTALASLAALTTCVEGEDGAAAEELSLVLLGTALGQLSSINLLRERLSEKRASTQDELLTRLRRARDRILDCHGLGVDLDGLSRTACLSRFHFLRLFRQVYGQTPLRFAASVRLQRAIRLAAQGDVDAALAAGGFRSKAAFRRACGKATHRHAA